MSCDAKIRPFGFLNDTEVRCEQESGHEAGHEGTLRDYARPGSETVIAWQEEDRRTFRGEWVACVEFPGCILPALHRGRHTV